MVLVRMLELVDRVFLSFTDFNRERSSRFSDIKCLCIFIINVITYCFYILFLPCFNMVTQKQSSINRGHGLIGKTAILHIVISGSIPDASTLVNL